MEADGIRVLPSGQLDRLDAAAGRLPPRPGPAAAALCHGRRGRADRVQQGRGPQPHAQRLRRQPRRVLLADRADGHLDVQLRLLADAGLNASVVDVDAFALHNAFEVNYPEAMRGAVTKVREASPSAAGSKSA
mgnify:CR=1 FL=1